MLLVVSLALQRAKVDCLALAKLQPIGARALQALFFELDHLQQGDLFKDARVTFSVIEN